MNLYKYLLLIAPLLLGCKSTEGTLVNNIVEFKSAAANATPGTTITLSHGVWEDTELTLVANGTEDNPIPTTVEQKGKVFLEGKSNIIIVGSHIHVDGLVFRNHYTPTREVKDTTFTKSEGYKTNDKTILTENIITNK